jgi:phage terminase large subunit-like protein
LDAVPIGKVTWRGREKMMDGTGLIPCEDIGGDYLKAWRRGSDRYSPVKHCIGGWSDLCLKSYEQGRGASEGTEKDLIRFDAEEPIDVYVETGMRTMTTGSHVLSTFTPVEGMSETALEFLPGRALPLREAGHASATCRISAV